MTTTEHEELLTFAKVTERLRQIPFTPLADQKTHRWMNDNCNNPDPAIEAKVDWWDVKQHGHCALCDLNDESGAGRYAVRQIGNFHLFEERAGGSFTPALSALVVFLYGPDCSRVRPVALRHFGC